MSSSSMESRSLEQPRRACRRESNTRKSAALLRPMMGTKEVDSWSTPSTRLAKLTTEGEDIAESGREGWIGASAATDAGATETSEAKGFEEFNSAEFDN